MIPARNFIHVVRRSGPWPPDRLRRTQDRAQHPGSCASRARLAVNMSARSVGYPGWMADSCAVPSRQRPDRGQPPFLEITETSAMQMPEIVQVFTGGVEEKGGHLCAGPISARATPHFATSGLSFRHPQDRRTISPATSIPDADNQVAVRGADLVGRHFDMIRRRAVKRSREPSPRRAGWPPRARIACGDTISARRA